MKRLLFIDDKEVVTNGYSANWRIEDWKSRVPDQPNYIDFSRTASDYFKWDGAGNECEPLIKLEEYAYVFIHHSQKDDNIIPSSIIDLIKGMLGERLILFSGNIQEYYLNSDNEKLIYRSITRDKLSTRFSEFIKKSVRLGEWIPEILFYDYEKYLIVKIAQMIYEEKGSEIWISKEMSHFLNLKYIDFDSTIYSTLMNCPEEDLIDALRNL